MQNRQLKSNSINAIMRISKKPTKKKQKTVPETFTSGRKLELAIPEIKKSYRIFWAIGSGHFGSIFLAQDKLSENPRFYAIKMINARYGTEVQNEIKHMVLLRGADNIIRYREHFRNDKNYAIVTNYINSENFYSSFKFFTPKQAQIYLKELLIAVANVHALNITHGDIKPENFLFHFQNQEFALIDFGMAHTQETNCMSKGTRGFNSPELALRTRLTTASDIFSVGIIMLTLIAKISPIFMGSDLDLMQELAVLFGFKSVREMALKSHSEEAVNNLVKSGLKDRKPIHLRKMCQLLRMYSSLQSVVLYDKKCNNCEQYQIFCICKEPLKTTSTKKATEKNKTGKKTCFLCNAPDPFPKCAYNLLQKMLCLDPSKRITAKAALKHRFFKERLTEVKHVAGTCVKMFTNGLIDALFPECSKHLECIREEAHNDSARPSKNIKQK